VGTAPACPTLMNFFIKIGSVVLYLGETGQVWCGDEDNVWRELGCA